MNSHVLNFASAFGEAAQALPRTLGSAEIGASYWSYEDGSKSRRRLLVVNPLSILW